MCGGGIFFPRLLRDNKGELYEPGIVHFSIFSTVSPWEASIALIAIGYTMVYGILRLINFAHGEIFMMGAYLYSGV
jgi:ABC-type branched-subunit amino acid transport system permease subunit